VGTRQDRRALGAGFFGHAVCAALLAALCALGSGAAAARAGVGPTVIVYGGAGVASLTDSQIVYSRQSDGLLIAKLFADGSETVASLLPDGTATTSYGNAVSPNGRFVSFASNSDHLAYVRDISLGQTWRLAAVGTPPQMQMELPLAISNDGGRVLIAAVDGEGHWGMWLLDTSSGLATSIAAISRGSAMSADGSTLAWRVPGAVDLYDVASGTTTSILAAGGAQQPGSYGVSVGGLGGRYVAYDRCADPTCADGSFVVDLYDRQTGSTRTIAPGWSPRLSPNGRYLAWNDFMPDYHVGNIRLLDLFTGAIRYANIGTDGKLTAGRLDGSISDSGAIASDSAWLGPSILVHWTDQTPPLAPTIGIGLLEGSQLVKGRIPIRVWWKGLGAICSTDLSQEFDGTFLHLGVSPSIRSVVRSTTSGVAAVYRADVTDCEGDRGPAATRGVTVTQLQEDAPLLRFSKAWTITPSSADSGGHARTTSRDGARFCMTIEAGHGQIAIIAATGPHRGRLTYEANGRRYAIDLYSPRSHARRIELVGSLTAGYQTVVFTAHTNPARYGVSIDGLLVAQQVN
jgi:hypothetical protein